MERSIATHRVKSVAVYIMREEGVDAGSLLRTGREATQQLQGRLTLAV